jgi:hypothetical protein
MLRRIDITRFCASLASVLLAGAQPVLAEISTVEFDVQPRVLKVGEAATCTITMQGGSSAPAPSLPPIPGFELVGTRSQQNFTLTSQGRQSTVSHLYQLTALEAGTFQIGPFSYRVDEKSFTLGPVEITVVTGAESDRSAANHQEDFLFATLTATRPESYIQQPVQLELALYWRDLNLDREIALDGFDSAGLRLGAWQDLPVTREVVREQLFEVRRFRCQAIPLTAGIFTLNPKLRVQILVRQSRSKSDPFFGNSMFDDMLFGRYRAQPAEVSVQPLQLTIRSLPTEGQPPEFGGAIGQFKMEVQAQPLSVNVGEPVTLNIRIQGTGNLDTITPPLLSGSDDFRRYEPKLVQQDANAGQKIFEMVLIPKSAASTNLPAITFAYFDPEAGRYERLLRDPIPLQVLGQSTSTRVLRHGDDETPTAPQSIGIDITHLMLKPPSWAAVGNDPWYLRPTVLPLHALPAVALIGAWWMTRRRKLLAGNPELARRRQAPRSARRALAAALMALEREPAERFFEALWQVLADYFGNRFNLSPGSVSSAEISRRLFAMGWDTARVAEILNLCAACEGARFGQRVATAQPLPPADQQVWRQRLDRLVDLMRECEKRP